jgi:DNA gyrase subunit A
MIVLKEAKAILVVTENGYGKRSELADYRVTSRGGKGIITVRNTDRNGPTVSIKAVSDEDELMIITKNGLVIRMEVGGISMMGRATKGVKLINLEPGDKVVDVAVLASSTEHDVDSVEAGGPAVDVEDEGVGDGSGVEEDIGAEEDEGDVGDEGADEADEADAGDGEGEAEEDDEGSSDEQTH